jgi:hypothetical protein
MVELEKGKNLFSHIVSIFLCVLPLLSARTGKQNEPGSNHLNVHAQQTPRASLHEEPSNFLLMT